MAKETGIVKYDASYDEKSDFPEKYIFSGMRKKLKEISGEIHGDILDLATATGKGLKLFENQDCRVTGVDLSKEALFVAEARARRSGISFKGVVANVEDMTSVVRDNSMDAVVCQLGFCTFDDPLKVIKEIDRVLCKHSGARVILLEHVVPSSWLMRTLTQLAAKKAKEKFGCDVGRRTLDVLQENGYRITADHSEFGGFIHATVLKRK